MADKLIADPEKIGIGLFIQGFQRMNAGMYDESGRPIGLRDHCQLRPPPQPQLADGASIAREVSKAIDDERRQRLVAYQRQRLLALFSPPAAQSASFPSPL